MEDDIEDIIYEPNLEKKEILNSPLKETKKVIIKEKKRAKNLKKDKNNNNHDSKISNLTQNKEN